MSKSTVSTLGSAVSWLRILYPIWMLIAIFSLMYIPSLFIIKGNPDLTSSNIADNTFLFRLGILGSLVTQLLFIIIPLLLYKIFESVSRSQATLMVVLALISVPITMYNELHKLTALSVLDNPVQMMDYLEINKQGILLSSIFWGLWLFPLAWLVYKSGYFPKVIGVALAIAGIGYVIGAFGNILIPDFKLLQSVTEMMTFGEIVFILWLVIKGVGFDREIQISEE